jgi:hypothetical protein
VAVWKALLIVYCELNVRLRYGDWRRRPFHHVATRPEIIDAVESFRAFPQLVTELTAGAAQVEHSIVEVDAALRSLTEERGPFFWPLPDDTRRELDKFAPAGSHKSILFSGRRTILKNARQFHVAVGDWEWPRAIGATAQPTPWLGMRLHRPGIAKHRARCGCMNGFTVFVTILRNRATRCRRQMRTAPKSTATNGHRPLGGRITTGIS